MNNAEPKRLILQNTVSLSNMRLNLDITEARVNKYSFILLKKKRHSSALEHTVGCTDWTCCH